MEQTVARPHRPWALWLLVALMAFGVAVGVYMARHHEVEVYGGEAYQGEELVGCADAEGVSCDVVNTSAWSEIAGVPTFAWAVPTYLLVAALAVLAARGRHGVKPLIVGIGLAAVGLSGWLYYVSVVELKYVCLWCMRLYAVNAGIVALGLASGVTRRDVPAGRDLGTAAVVFAVLAALTVGVQKGYRAHISGGAPAVAELAEVADDQPVGADPQGPPPALAYDITTEEGKPARVTVHAGDAWKGSPTAKVAIVEFADFECPYCKRASGQLERVFQAYRDDVVFVYKPFPMDPACNPGVKNKMHRNACNAHLAGACAQEQGRFWAMHDLLYKNQHALEPDALMGYARVLGLDLPRFAQCLKSPRPLEAIRASGQEGADAGVHGTPRIWIGGQLYRSGASAEQLAKAVADALGRSAVALADDRQDAPAPTSIPADVPAMRRVKTGDLDFWIDTFEASVADGAARSGRHEVPGVRMSWFAAKDACEAAGKRLCTEQEWIAACQGAAPVDDDRDGEFADDMIEGDAYPYGDFHAPGRCWEDHPARPTATLAGEPPPTEAWRPVYTGEMPACVSRDGVYDLTGNVEEWVGATPETAVLLGGAFDTPEDKARCYRRNDTFGAGYASLRTGFRCCKGP
jgi:protein-disulfide isomerase/uncharacterized membrane protein